MSIVVTAFVIQVSIAIVAFVLREEVSVVGIHVQCNHVFCAQFYKSCLQLLIIFC